MSRIYCKCCSKGFDTPKDLYSCPNCGADNKGDTLDAPYNTPTLRDRFAMSALQGMLTTAGGPCLHGLDGIELQTAAAAYRLADAMLEARK